MERINDSDLPRAATQQRPRHEGKDERKARKQAIKEERKVREMEGQRERGRNIDRRIEKERGREKGGGREIKTLKLVDQGCIPQKPSFSAKLLTV